MSDKLAALKGTFADIKTVRTRGVFQIVVEVPMEQYQDAVAMLGPPTGDTWVAVARLRGAAESSPEHKPKRRFHEMPRSQQAAVKCQDSAFDDWLRMTYGGGSDDCCPAADMVRALCGVTSRRELDTDGQAAARWDGLVQRYESDMGYVAEKRA